MRCRTGLSIVILAVGIAGGMAGVAAGRGGGRGAAPQPAAQPPQPQDDAAKKKATDAAKKDLVELGQQLRVARKDLDEAIKAQRSRLCCRRRASISSRPPCLSARLK